MLAEGLHVWTNIPTSREALSGYARAYSDNMKIVGQTDPWVVYDVWVDTAVQEHTVLMDASLSLSR